MDLDEICIYQFLDQIHTFLYYSIHTGFKFNLNELKKKVESLTMELKKTIKLLSKALEERQ